MDNKLTETLPAWVAPRLMRLNQADGTDKHVAAAESAPASGGLIYPGCSVVATFGSHSAIPSGGGGVCAGPS